MNMSGDRLDLTRSSTKNEEISDIKPFRVDEINVKKSNGRSKRQLKVDMLPSVTQNVYVIDRHPVFRNSRPQPTILQLSKLNYNGIRRRPFLARQELMKDKLLSQELGARLAEAKLTLLGPDAVLEEADTRARAKKRRSDKRHQPPHHVSFLSVSKRVTNIIRFRQAAQGQQSGSGIEKVGTFLTWTSCFVCSHLVFSGVVLSDLVFLVLSDFACCGSNLVSSCFILLGCYLVRHSVVLSCQYTGEVQTTAYIFWFLLLLNVVGIL